MTTARRPRGATVRRAVITSVVLVTGLGLAGCGSGSSGSTTSTAAAGGSAASANSQVTGDITVLAAASLTESFTTIAQQFEAAHPGTTVTLSFGASSALATQVTSGAPADVFASASAKNMDAVVSAGAATDPKTFAQNVMEIAVPPSNPGGVTGLASLAGSGVKTALCQEQVPCGATAATVFANAGVTVKPVTLEPDVKSVLSKVTLGEVDAGVVYVTDVRAAGDKVEGIPIPADVNASTSYPIAALDDAPNAATAKAFVDYVLSAEGAKVLTAAGFEQP
ncbi:molybdate ABC transporter substrate-binding protein [Phycicoccus sp. KQZ13P-1]|uniref:molybdate ABC transporter substrate-binding protein n=1 Tax=Phycicoccus mangrovi TaxID=2840470 RepID=UPI001C002525|nr:molybdate ABC transporter substrate-binding protein [Phycicoccus mangrovi]MBT9256159.1 molybdate ABC transporter substrate-binding protein [Phycicoccus mangrovi]